MWVAKSEWPTINADKDDYVKSSFFFFFFLTVNKLLSQLSVHILARLRADIT